jgi:hypothetical protein
MEVFGWIAVLRRKGKEGGGAGEGWTRARVLRSKVFRFRRKRNARDGHVARTIAGTMPAAGRKFGEKNGEIQHVAEVISLGGKLKRKRTTRHPNLAVNPLCQTRGGNVSGWVGGRNLRVKTRLGGVSEEVKMAARLGVEPRQNESESFVLPLHHRAGNCLGRESRLTRQGLAGGSGAGDGIRTRNRLFTKQVLYH